MSVVQRDNDLKKNGAGYVDPTAGEALINVRRAELLASDRYYNLLDHINYIVDLAGFEIEGEFKLKDLRTNKVWRKEL